MTTDVPPESRDALVTILHRGPLARRILTALDNDFSPSRLSTIYRQLCDCLSAGRSFKA
jgi:hypothetical protein